MRNCLVTKLKGVVDNDNLKKLGVVKLHATQIQNVTYAEQLMLRIGTVGEDITIKTYGGGSFSDNADGITITEKTLTAADGIHVFTFSNGTYDAEIINKYGLCVWGPNYNKENGELFTYDVNDLDFCSSITSIMMNYGAQGDIGFVKRMAGLTVLSLKGNGLIGDINAVSQLTGLTTLQFGECYNLQGDISNISLLVNLTLLDFGHTNLEGNISALANMTELTFLGLSDSKVTGDIASLAKLTKVETISCYRGGVGNEVYGSLESMAQGMVDNGRTSGTLTISCNGVITYNGEPVPNETVKTITFSNGGYTVS